MRAILMSTFGIASCLFGQGGANCSAVGGGIVTNFTSDTRTLGTATGDLRGALGVDVLSVTPAADGSLTFHVQHHWVTDSGESISVADTDATAYPIAAVPGVYAITFNSGIEINGGTGPFAGASGKLRAFGAANFPAGQVSRGQITLRYAGRVCLKPVTAD